ncbi:protein TUNICAMYCIN INDUCED 1-like [Musa acuminata AAA Group]|uniref:protein TUNICAMYCIN INDUCED 1-like n=1 Tax=Musa acuminata AAA Group TaxID=214697 RepID=UPI0031DA7EDF
MPSRRPLRKTVTLSRPCHNKWSRGSHHSLASHSSNSRHTDPFKPHPNRRKNSIFILLFVSFLEFLRRSMATRSLLLVGFLNLVMVGVSNGLISSNPSTHRAISNLRDAVVKGLGIHAEGVEVSGFDVRDVRVGQSVAYEFDIEIDKKVIPIKLSEDVRRWDSVDRTIFGEDGEGGGDATGLVRMGRRPDSMVPPVLSPFQLAGPLELWIQDGDDMRLFLPHDVEAGALKKVILSDGAVVTVKGARSVSLRRPLELPLPFLLNRTHHSGHQDASGLLATAEAVRRAAGSKGQPLLSLRIVGPTSLTSSPSTSPHDKLKLRRLAPGLVELSSRSIPTIAVQKPTLWPLTSLNGSDSNLQGFEEMLASVLGPKGKEEGSFQLLRAKVSARNYIKTGFTLVENISDDEVDRSGFPEWMTRPEKAMTQFEVLARMEENGEVVPERIAVVKPVQVADSELESVATGNSTMSGASIVHPPPSYFTL